MKTSKRESTNESLTRSLRSHELEYNFAFIEKQLKTEQERTYHIRKWLKNGTLYGGLSRQQCQTLLDSFRKKKG